jgi:2-polyprenyl-3-methyl-5-hydroxy-6-metoxy-1,4-benzoquinol methylase
LHEHRRKMYNEVGAYRNSFIDPATGLMDEKYLERRSCPCCGSSKNRDILVKNGGQYVVCEDCSMVFLNPVFRDECLEEYYRHNNTVQAAAHEEESTFYRDIYNSGLEQIRSATRCTKILDVGCSSGFFLDIAKASGMETYGIELNRLEHRIAEGKGHRVWDKVLSQVDFQTRFDAITLWDVFEHIKDGIGYLRQLAPHLNPDGVVFMQIPSAQSLAARILQEKCNMFEGLEHVSLYNTKTIRMVADAAGYGVAGMKSVIHELDPIFNHINYEHPYFGSFQRPEGLEFLTPELVLEKFLGYKLQVILKKR